MISVKAVLRKKLNSKGEYPIVIRITKDRRTSYIYTKFYTKLSDWDDINNRVRKNYPNSERVNNFLAKQVSKALNEGLKATDSSKEFTANELTKKIKNVSPENNFFHIASQYIENLQKQKKFNQLTADKPRVEHFKEFVKTNNLPFESITSLKLQEFSSWLVYNRKVSERTVMNHLVVIRTIFNMAIGSGIIEKSHYPFGRNKVVIKFPDATKIGLTKEEVKNLERFDFSDNPQKQHAKNIWLFSFYLAGMRVSDVLRLKWKDIPDNRLYYAMEKNGKFGSLKLPQKAIDIIENYKDIHPEYIFPDITNANFKDDEDVTRKVNNATHVLNKYLKRIAKDLGLKKPLTMHIARHTFGNISGDKIPIQMLQKLYRHSSVTTTINYQGNFIFKDVDEALDSVIK